MRQSLALLCAFVLLMVFSHWWASHNAEPEFTGTDNQAVEQIAALRPGYGPWFESLWAPSAPMESLLFALQAAVGAGIIGYCLGVLHTRARIRGQVSRAPD